jgi:hypothetical protein
MLRAMDALGVLIVVAAFVVAALVAFTPLVIGRPSGDTPGTRGAGLPQVVGTGIIVVIAIASIYVLLSQDYSEATEKWASGGLGALLGASITAVFKQS